MTERPKNKPRVRNHPVMNTSPFKGKNLLVILPVTMIIVIALISVFSMMRPKKNHEKIEKEDHSTMAEILCAKFLEGRLKYSFASYPTSQARNIGHNTYVVDSYVEAENSSGAKSRTDFYCKIKYRGGYEGHIGNWDLIELNID